MAYKSRVTAIAAVSTHSRPKAAGFTDDRVFHTSCGFQHTAARRRLASDGAGGVYEFEVSTHSRPKAAGYGCRHRLPIQQVSTHSRPKAAGAANRPKPKLRKTSFNTQPPEGGWFLPIFEILDVAGFNTQPPEGGWFQTEAMKARYEVSTHSRPKAAGAVPAPHTAPPLFQHTAARRRLESLFKDEQVSFCVSTHSRPKAAGSACRFAMLSVVCFNTQPPEGGWFRTVQKSVIPFCFNTQPPEGGWKKIKKMTKKMTSFNTQPPEGGWSIKGQEPA